MAFQVRRAPVVPTLVVASRLTGEQAGVRSMRNSSRLAYQLPVVERARMAKKAPWPV